MTIDPSTQTWPNSTDVPSFVAPVDGQERRSPLPQADTLGGGGGVFMGVSTPPGNVPM